MFRLKVQIIEVIIVFSLVNNQLKLRIVVFLLLCYWRCDTLDLSNKLYLKRSAHITGSVVSFSGSQRPVHRSGSHAGSRDGSQPRHGPRRLESLRLFWRQLHHGRSAQVRTEAEVKVGGETEAVRERHTMTHVIQSDAVSFYRPRLSYTCVSDQMINLQHDDQTINEEKPRDSDRTQTIKLFLSKKNKMFHTFCRDSNSTMYFK